MNVMRFSRLVSVVPILFLVASMTALPQSSRAVGNATATVTGAVKDVCPTNGVEQWDVVPGSTVTLTLDGVTECSGASIPLNLSWADTPVALVQTGPGSYSVTFVVPANATCTTPIKYCVSNVFARSKCSPTQQVHLRATDANGTDICGNCVCTVPPTLVGCPTQTNLTVQCLSLVPTAATVTATDNCGSVGVVFSETQSNAGSNCNNVVTRTWTAHNNCGDATCSQVITVNDTTAPSITGTPAGGDLGCNPSPIPDDNSVKAQVVTSDNCGGSPTVGVSHTDAAAGCTTTRTFTITATDSCGNAAQPATVVYSWKTDTTAPEIKGVPAGGSLGCNPGTLPTDDSIRALVSATDNCDGDLPATSITVTHVDGGTACAPSVTFTITAVDGCGNKGTATVSYDWKIDTAPPTIKTVPAGGNLGCNPSDKPTDDSVKAAVTVEDNCDGNPTINVSHSDVVLKCTTTRTFTITAKDACGNTSPESTVVYSWKDDTTPPSITGCPGSVLTILPDCGPPGPANFTVKLHVSDNCDDLSALTLNATVSNPASSVSFTIDPATGDITLTGTVVDGDTVSFTAMDSCSKTAECKFTARVNSVPCSLITVTKIDGATGAPLGGFKFTVTYTDPRSGVVQTITTAKSDGGSGATSVTIPQGSTSVSICEVLPPVPSGCHWVQTFPVSANGTPICYNFPVLTTDQSVVFANNCECPLLGGLTLGFWSNKNGQKVLQSTDPAWRTALNGLNLRDGNGTKVTIPAGLFTTVYGNFRTWLLGGKATNMAYMLSVQLAAAQLNVTCPSSFGGLAAGTKVVLPANAVGCYISILAAHNKPTNTNVAMLSDVIQFAVEQLAAHPVTTAASDPTNRAIQGCLETILDGFNNNTFPQSLGCDPPTYK